MHTPIHIVGIAGSLRKESLNKKLLNAAKELCPEGLELEIIDIGDIPLYNGDLEDSGIPESVQTFKQSIAHANGVLIVTPEYNHSIPGVLKNVIDWGSRPENVWTHKPIAIMGVSEGLIGTARAQEHLRQILAHQDAYTMNKPDVIIPFGDKKIDTNGNFADEKALVKVKLQLESFVKWIKKIV